MIRLHSLVIAAAVAAPATALATPVERRLHSNSLEASSFLWNDWNKFQENYHPNYVADDDPKTAWVEGVTGSGKGEWLRINLTPLDHTTKIRLKIRNGYQKSSGLFKANARAKDVTVRLLPSKTELKAVLVDKNGWQELALTQPDGQVKAIELAVGSVYEGTRYEDLCISDVQVFATSETADNPAFEKGKHKELLAWRTSRVAAAKLFAKRKIDIPFHPAYKVTTTEREDVCSSCAIPGMVAAAAADAGFAEWKPVLATAAAVIGEMEKLPRGQIAPASKQSLIEVDGFATIDLDNFSEGYFEPDTMRLPSIDSVSAMFAEQLRVLDVKDTLKPSQYEGDKCRGNISWVKRRPSTEKTGPETVQAIVLGTCGMVEGREGSYPVATTQLLVYDTDGRLALVVGDGHIDAYRWAVEDGKPMVVGGRALLGQGNLIEATKQQ